MRDKDLFKAFAIAGAFAAIGWGQAIPNNVTLRDFFGGQATFTRPVYFVEMPQKDSTYAVVEQPGRVQIVRRQNNAWVKSQFVQVSVSGGSSGGQEDGLLGLAFHPNYLQNRKYYLFLLRNQGGGLADFVIERTADATLLQDGGAAERVILRVSDPASNHNGGTLQFGLDGYLYISIGDGGPQNDPANRAQNPDSLLGKILRINVDQQAGGNQYAIPTDNPFVNRAGYRPEIYALGFRNPYRFSLHPTRGELWVGDVGQDAYEEWSLIPKGGNAGWKVREGAHCRPGGPSTCSSTGMTDPVYERAHSQGECSAIGGSFFRGDPTASYHDVYIFGDYCSGRIWGLRYANGSIAAGPTQIGTLSGLAAITFDSRGRVFAMSVSSNTIRILESPDMRPNPTSIRPGKEIKAIPRADLLKRDKYVWKTLNGREVEGGKASGLHVVSEKGSRAPAQLVPAIW